MFSLEPLVSLLLLAKLTADLTVAFNATTFWKSAFSFSFLQQMFSSIVLLIVQKGAYKAFSELNNRQSDMAMVFHQYSSIDHCYLVNGMEENPHIASKKFSLKRTITSHFLEKINEGFTTIVIKGNFRLSIVSRGVIVLG